MITDLAYPLKIINGNLQTVSGDEVIHQHIRSWLETELKERVMRLDYGTENFLFETKNDWAIVAMDITRDLIKEIPQADFNVSIEADNLGNLEVTVNWSTDIQQAPIVFTV